MTPTATLAPAPAKAPKNRTRGSTRPSATTSVALVAYFAM